MQESIEEIRKKEMKMIRKAAVANTAAHLLNIAAPIFVRLYMTLITPKLKSCIKFELNLN